MLFYEPLFLFVFFPSFYLIYLLGERREALRRGVILCASVLFYAWSGPLFAPVVLASALVDHLIARRIESLPPRSRQARLLLALGVLLNLGILVHYSTTRFLIENLNDLLLGFCENPLPVPAIILPIGVSFIVFEKITYLVDIYRRISRPAGRLATYLLYVFFFPKLLAGPIIKYHEMEDQLAAMPTARLDDISNGFLRFMVGVAKKTLIADTLATGADKIFAADASGIGFSHAWSGVIFFTFQIYFDFSGYSDMAIGIAHMLGFRLRENFDMPVHFLQHHRVLATLAHLAYHLDLASISTFPSAATGFRPFGSISICGSAFSPLACGMVPRGPTSPGVPTMGCSWYWTGCSCCACWIGSQKIVANFITFAIVVVGWIIFRAHSWNQAIAFLRAMIQPGLPNRVAGLFVTPDMTVAAIMAAVICAMPRMPGFHRIRHAVFATPAWTLALQTAISLVFVLAVGKAVADPFKPFLYFQF